MPERRSAREAAAAPPPRWLRGLAFVFFALSAAFLAALGLVVIWVLVLWIDGPQPVNPAINIERAYDSRVEECLLDIQISRNGRVLGGLEIKTGGSRYLPSQRAKDWYLSRIAYRVQVIRW